MDEVGDLGLEVAVDEGREGLARQQERVVELVVDDADQLAGPAVADVDVGQERLAGDAGQSATVIISGLSRS